MADKLCMLRRLPGKLPVSPLPFQTRQPLRSLGFDCRPTCPFKSTTDFRSQNMGFLQAVNTRPVAQSGILDHLLKVL